MHVKNKHFLVLLMIVAGCQEATHPQDKEMKDLMNRELKNQQTAKYGNKSPDIQVITDAGQLAEWRKLVQYQMQLRQESEQERLSNKNLGDLYKAGNKAIVPDIISTLKTGNKDEIKILLSQLQKDYDDPADYKIREQEIIDPVLQAVNDPALEKDAVQLAGLNELPGRIAVFENRLRSGKSTDEGRILYWLGADGTSTVTLPFITQLIREEKVKAEDLDGILDCLEKYGKKGDAATKSLVGDLALAIYRKNLIPRADFEELKESAYSSDAAESLLTCLFNYGNEQVIPIANDILNRKIRIVGPVTALVRLQGPKHLDKVYTYLRNKDNFYTGLDIVTSLDKKYVDDKLLKEVLLQFTKQKDLQDYQVETITRSFIEMKETRYIQHISSYITDPKMVSRFQNAFKLYNYSPDSVIADCIQADLLHQPPAASIIEKAKKEGTGDVRGFLYDILSSQKLYLTFDAEADRVPVDYGELLNQFAGCSEGLLKDMQVAQQVWEDKNGKPSRYRVVVLYKDRGFLVQPPDLGDWYDIMTVNALLNKVLEQAGAAKRFVSIDTGDQTVQYIFGEEDKIRALQKKYAL